MTMQRGDRFTHAGTPAALAALGCNERGAATTTVPARPLAPPLTPPASGPIPVAFVLSEGAVVIDFAGPWQVFDDAAVAERDPAFAPARVIVVPAQRSRSEVLHAWLRTRSATADVTMAVCTGAFVLARAGLLAGRAATTFHGAFDDLAAMHPDVDVIRGARFVEDGPVATSGGLSAGIDLALRVVERYFGRAAATATAYAMEYQGRGWMDPSSNAAYASTPHESAVGPRCPVCEMHVGDAAAAPSSAYRGTTYWFCSVQDKQGFDADPANFAHG